jgi:hypothetical protein
MTPFSFPLVPAPPSFSGITFLEAREFMEWFASNYYLTPHRRAIERETGLTINHIYGAAMGKDLPASVAAKIREIANKYD